MDHQRQSLGETSQLQNVEPAPATAAVKAEETGQQTAEVIPAGQPPANTEQQRQAPQELTKQEGLHFKQELPSRQDHIHMQSSEAGPSGYGGVKEEPSSQQAALSRCSECYVTVAGAMYGDHYCSPHCQARAQLRQNAVPPENPYFSAGSASGSSSLGFFLGENVSFGTPYDDYGGFGAYDDDDDDYPDSAWPIQDSSREDALELIQYLSNLPDIEVPPDGRKRKPKALRCSLMPHQEIGLTWLLEQEHSTRRGGILADAMGLGKTIQALALILAHPSKDSVHKTTLIVAPVALLRQWEREIGSKVKTGHKLKTIIVHGPQKKKMTVSELQTYDVVLTSYGTIASEWNPRKRQNPNTVLLRSRYHRIILDEAHIIKNHRSKTAQAISSMRTTYRICLTGTPIMNNLAEIYSLINFLRIHPYDSWTSFNREFIKKINGKNTVARENAMRALQAFLRGILLQRTPTSKIDGQQIIRLPDLNLNISVTEFDHDQKEFYLALEHRMRLRFNKFVRAGTVGKHYSYILVLILRLRQCCCHPHLIKDFGIPDAVELTPDEMVELAGRLDRRVVNRIKGQPEEVLCPLCEDTSSSPIVIYPCGHLICGECFAGMMQLRDMEAIVLRGAESHPACPSPGCDQEVDSSRVICYPYFLEAHSSESSEGGSESADENVDAKDLIAADEEEEAEEADDVDEHGDLKDFVVPDNEHGDENDHLTDFIVPDTDDIDEDADGGIDHDRIISKRSASATPPKTKVESGDETGSESDDSLPSLGEVWQSAVSQKVDRQAATSLPTRKQRLAPLKGGAKGSARAQTRVKKEENDADRFSDSDDDFERGQANPLIKDEHADTKPRPSNKRQRISHAKSAASSGSTVDHLSYLTDSEDDVKSEQSTDRKGKRKRPVIKQEQKAVAGSNRGPASKKPKSSELTFAELRQAGRRNGEAKQRYLRRLRLGWQPSAKTDKAMELLQSIRNQDPREKTLIFSVFTSFLDLLEIPVADAGFTYRRYDGSMANSEREEAVEDFLTKPDVTVMLVSLKAGNAGLNLQAATQVIIVEPFWNPSVEDQAIGRAHRLGQPKPVTVHRLLIRDTVEDRILALQDQKRRLVSEVLNNEAAKGLSRLSINELASLFGITRNRRQRPAQ